MKQIQSHKAKNLLIPSPACAIIEIARVLHPQYKTRGIMLMAKLKTYRGHIRNHKALCQELGIEAGLSRQEREEKILLEGYKKWGEELGNHIYGMFALAIEDGEKIFCLRDQFGTKPFYYHIGEDGTFHCGTFIKDILDKGVKKELNEDMLQLFLTLTYPAGEDTFFKGIKKLMPGHTLTYENGKVDIKTYFKPEFKADRTKTLDEYADKIHSTLLEIMQDVKDEDEVAESFLSGGVDSSYVFALSDAKLSDSCGYDEERFDESPLAKQTADILGRENSRALITPEAYFSAIPYVMKNMEQPLADASAIVFALGCIETSKHTKLCYSGEGADEFFGGYNMYRNAERYGDNLKTFYVGNTNIMKEDEKKLLLKNYKEDLLPIDLVKDLYQDLEGLDPLTKMSAVDINIWLEGDIYLNVDKMSTCTGLEIRMPLTDVRMFSIAASMPPEYKVNDTDNKVAFRKAAAKVLPEEIAYRKKLGFIVPIRIWMADERYNKDVKETLFGKTAEKFFNTQYLKDMFNEYIGGNSDLWRKIYTVYAFLVWYREYFEN